MITWHIYLSWNFKILKKLTDFLLFYEKKYILNEVH